MFDALPDFDENEPSTADAKGVASCATPALDAWYRPVRVTKEMERMANKLINSKGIIYASDLAHFMYEIEGC